MHELRKSLLCTIDNRFITHLTDSDWGGSVLIMEKNGKAFCRTYWFNDDNNSIYFDFLSVDSDERKKGIATYLLDHHINASKQLNVNSYLWVKKDSWMHEWYKRKGYSNDKDYEGQENAIWMKLT